VTPRGGRYIFLFLNGGMDQLDSFDIKEGKWTPPDFDVRTVKPGVRMPFSLFRSSAGNSITWPWRVRWKRGRRAFAGPVMQVGHPFSPARRGEMALRR
jgi:hypothetical protein